MVMHVRARFYDASNDLAEMGFYTGNLATQAEIEDLLTAIDAQSALQLRGYDVTKELDVSGIDTAGKPASLATEPFADDKHKLVIEMQSENSKTVTKFTVPGPALTGSGITLQNNARVSLPGDGNFITLVAAIAATCTDRAGEALSGARRSYLDMQRGRRGLG